MRLIVNFDIMGEIHRLLDFLKVIGQLISTR